MINPVEIIMRNRQLRTIYYKYFKYYTTQRFDELLLVFFLLKKAGIKGVMLDVGSHFGESAQPFLLLGWTVHGFEPDPDRRKQHALSSLAKQFPRFHLHDLAVSNEHGQSLSFYVSEESTGVSSLLPFTQGHQPVKQVTTCTLDHFASDNGIDTIDFLKIDTEGNDLRVLQGCDLARRLPRAIICEFEDNKTKIIGYDYHDLGDYLLAAGYDVYLSEWYPIERYGVEHCWRCVRRYPCNTNDPSCWGNFIALQKDLSPAFIRMLKRKYNIDMDEESSSVV